MNTGKVIEAVITLGSKLFALVLPSKKKAQLDEPLGQLESEKVAEEAAAARRDRQNHGGR